MEIKEFIDFTLFDEIIARVPMLRKVEFETEIS